ncbi:MAG: hypothetical protein WC670_18930 [Pseudolabrys sp.]|jgi:hypothetical protein
MNFSAGEIEALRILLDWPAMTAAMALGGMFTAYRMFKRSMAKEELRLRGGRDAA